VSNCRTERPGAPVLGFPDCAGSTEPPGWGTTTQLLRDAGIPVPDNYGFPSYKAVQESLTIRLQTLRIGEVLLAACACEPITDMALNLKSRADDREGNEFLGYEWDCTEPADGDATVTCDFRHAAHLPADLREVDRDAYELMVAQIRNDAAGWEDDLASLQGEVAAADPAEVYGNFTHDELDGETGYRLPLMVGMAGDYIGYVVTSREHQRGDHYRKALTAFGPHTADYVNTRLVAMAAALKGDDDRLGALDPIDPAALADDTVQSGSARIIGVGGSAGLDAYEAAIPDDGGTPGRVLAAPPARLERFGAATMTWEGGSNWTDNPVVTVERFVPGRRGAPEDAGRPEETPPGTWETVATQEGGEVVLILAYDSYRSSAPVDWLTGGKAYAWTATWEAYDATEPGRYRFAVEGHHRSDRAAQPYAFASEPFTVTPWTGITATDLQVDGDRATFGVAGVEAEAAETPGPVGPVAADRVRYPFTYDGPARFLSPATEVHSGVRYCFRCTFRPWAPEGRITEAGVTVLRADGAVTRHPASLEGERFATGPLDLAPGDRVVVAPSDLVDEHGNTNGAEVAP
jgi:hypothetical protein